jgi:hypothetical protein
MPARFSVPKAIGECFQLQRDIRDLQLQIRAKERSLLQRRWKIHDALRALLPESALDLFKTFREVGAGKWICMLIDQYVDPQFRSYKKRIQIRENRDDIRVMWKVVSEADALQRASQMKEAWRGLIHSEARVSDEFVTIELSFDPAVIPQRRA